MTELWVFFFQGARFVVYADRSKKLASAKKEVSEAVAALQAAADGVAVCLTHTMSTLVCL